MPFCIGFLADQHNCRAREMLMSQTIVQFHQPIANTLPQDGVLICDTPAKPRLQAILASVGSFFRSQGHQVMLNQLSFSTPPILDDL